MRAKFINEKFTQDSDPIHDMGIGNIYNIDFFYDDHPSIENSYVAEFIENLESTIENIDPEAVYEIRMTDFADGFVQFKGSNLLGKDMLKKLKKAREKSMDSMEDNLASWDFGEVSKGVNHDGKLYDPSDYEMEHCDNCGEEITYNNTLTGDGYCDSCFPDDENEVK